MRARCLPFRISIAGLVAGLSLLGCDSSTGQDNPGSTTPSARPGYESASQQRRGLQVARRKYEARQRHKRSFVRVEFEGFDEQGHIVVTMENLTDKGIDRMYGTILAENERGITLGSSGFGKGYSEGVLIEVGATLEHRFRPKRGLKKQLVSNPEVVAFSFSARAIIYDDQSKQSGL